MSLTSLIRQPQVAARLRALVSLPVTESRAALRVAPRHTSYALVGTAFDYALRWLVGAWNRTPATQWIAESAADLWEDDCGERNSYFDRGIARARELERELRKTEVFTRRMARACLFLASVDGYLRSGAVSLSEQHAPLATEVEDVLALVREIPREQFLADAVLLNPTFRKFSEAVGGADADLIVGDCLIDVKTTKYLRLTEEYLHQLVGYSALQLRARPEWRLKYVAVYFSRHGLLERYALDEVLERGMDWGLEQVAACLLGET